MTVAYPDSAVAETLATGLGQLLVATTATVEDLIARCPAQDPIRVGLEQLHDTMQRITALTGQLSRVERHLPPRTTTLDINSVVQRLMPSLQRLLGPFISLETDLHSPSLWTACERSQLEQILLGMVVNAREALPLGGTVRVSTRRLEIDRVCTYRVGTLTPGVWAALEVRDSGGGFDERMVRHLLEPALRGLPFDSSLSLSTIAGLVREMGGQVILETGRGDGAMLRACLPAVAQPRTRQPATGVAEAVLVVSADEWIRLSATRILKRAAIGVLEAHDADEALELLDDVAGSCVRLVIADAAIAQGGSVSLANTLHATRPEIELLIMVPRGTSHDGARLETPLAEDELLAAVRRLRAVA